MPKIDFNNLRVVRVSTGAVERQYNCPSCEDKKARLYHNTISGYYYCFNCGARGKSKTTTSQAAYADSPKLSSRVRPTSLPRINESGREYLRSHNVDPKVAYSFGVRSAKDIPTRLIFPARIKNGAEVRTVFVSSHNTLPPPKSKLAYYKKADGYGKIHPAVYGLKDGKPTYPSINPRRIEMRVGVLVEGAGDALRLSTFLKEEWGKYVPIALFGKNLNEEGCSFLAKNYDRFIIMLDKGTKKWEREGEHFASERLAAMLSVFSNGKVVEYRDLPAKDPATLTDSECERVFEEIGKHV